MIVVIVLILRALVTFPIINAFGCVQEIVWIFTSKGVVTRSGAL